MFVVGRTRWGERGRRGRRWRRWRIRCRCAIVLARHFCILPVRERLPSGSSNSRTAHAFRVALDIIIIIIHFCHSAVTYIHTLHFHAGLKKQEKIEKKEYEKLTKKGLRKSLPNMSRLWIFVYTKEELQALPPPMSWMYDARLYTLAR